MKKISYRKCRRKDLMLALRLVGTSINHLRRRTGKEPFRVRVTKIPPWFVHLLGTDPDTSYCAWCDDKLVGFAVAVVRGKQWYLAYLFVHPRWQDKGVGNKLLGKVWRDGRNMTHSLCTFAFNMRAVGLYSKFGMAPLCNLPWMQAEPEKLKKIEPTGLKVIDTCSRADIKWINGLESKIRGYPHSAEWNFWKKSDRHKLYLFKNRGRRIGYCLIVEDNWIAPLGVVSKNYMTRAMAEALRLVKPKKGAKVSLWCPTQNIDLYRFLIGIGLYISCVRHGLPLIFVVTVFHCLMLE